MFIFYSSMGIFHFSDEALKGARKRRGKPRLDQHMRSNLEALQRSPPTKEAIKWQEAPLQLREKEQQVALSCLCRTAWKWLEDKEFYFSG